MKVLKYILFNARQINFNIFVILNNKNCYNKLRYYLNY